MNKAPSLYNIETMVPFAITCKINNKWVPARPLGLYSLRNRLKLAWMVFTGKADALTWPGGQ